MNKLLKVIIIVICVLCIIGIVFGGDDTDTDTANTELSATTIAPETTATPEPAMTKSEFKAAVDSILDDSFTAYGHETKWDDDIFVVNVWGDGLAVGAMLAASGDANCAESWSTMRANNEYLCETICDVADDNGLDIHVNFNLLNETNLDKVLLSVYDGVTIYDVAN